MGSYYSNQFLAFQTFSKYQKHSHYGDCVLYTAGSNKIYQSFKMDESSAQQFITLLQERRKLKHRFLITPNGFFNRQKRQICSLQTIHQFFVQYQYVSRTLQQQILKYCQQQRPFPQSQLKKIFICVVQTLLYLQNNKTCHGDIKPSNIMVDIYGNVKLIDSYFINGGKISYQIVMDNPSSMSLLSPQQLNTIKNKKFFTINRVHQSQVWSLGLTMLQAMTAQPAMECYNLTAMMIKPNYFSNKLNELKKLGYSIDICQLVMSCILNEEKTRPNFRQIIKILRGIPKINRI